METKKSQSALQNEETCHIGPLMRVWRAELGMTQKDVAEKLGISPQQFQKYEAGVTGIELGRLFEICKILGKPPSALLAATGSVTESNKKGPDQHHAQQASQAPDTVTSSPFSVVQADISFHISEVVSEFLAIKSQEDRSVAIRILRCLARNPGL